jgi:hypothetical protein
MRTYTYNHANRLMSVVQGYNTQEVVTKEQIIIAADVTQEENDVSQLHPMLEQARHEL